MRLFVETHDVPGLLSKLKTWHPEETCEDVRLYGAKTKGLIVTNFQLPTEFPENIDEFGSCRWVNIDKCIGIELAPSFVREKDIKQNEETLNISLAFVFLLVLFWVTFAWGEVFK